MAAQHLEPEELQESLPMTLPMTHLLEEPGRTMFGIAKYPIDKWIESGEPMISTHGWIKLCMKICAKDMTNLDKVMTLCHTPEARLW
eukprot:6520539-Prorocentrum_lima.AAC.1